VKTFKQFLEAAGDPIKPEQVISLNNPEVQKNLRNATVPPVKSTKRVNPFVDRYIKNTSYLFPTPF